MSIPTYHIVPSWGRVNKVDAGRLLTLMLASGDPCDTEDSLQKYWPQSNGKALDWQEQVGGTILEKLKRLEDQEEKYRFHRRDTDSNDEEFLKHLRQESVSAINDESTSGCLNPAYRDEMMQKVSKLSTAQLKTCVDGLCDHLRSTSRSVGNVQTLMDSIMQHYRVTGDTGETLTKAEVDSLVFHPRVLERDERYESLFDCLKYQAGQASGHTNWRKIIQYLKTYDLTQGTVTSEMIARIVDYGTEKGFFAPTVKERQEGYKRSSVETTGGRAELE